MLRAAKSVTPWAGHCTEVPVPGRRLTTGTAAMAVGMFVVSTVYFFPTFYFTTGMIMSHSHGISRAILTLLCTAGAWWQRTQVARH